MKTEEYKKITKGKISLPIELEKNQENMKRPRNPGGNAFQLNTSISKTVHLGPESHKTSIISAGTLLSLDL